MSDEKVGIKETKEVVQLLVAVLKACVESISDGHFDLWDSFKFFPALRMIAPAIKDIGKCKAELMDLSEEEKKELCDMVAAELSLSNKTVESHLVMAMQAVIYLLDLMGFAARLKSH